MSGDRVGTDAVRRTQDALDHAIATAPTATSTLHADAPLVAGSTLTAGAALALFTDQLTSRTLDVVARELQARGLGFYTIASAGHEDNALLGALTRPDDPALLHYRSGGLVLARARRAGAAGVVDDVLRSFAASRDDPIAQGRHKVWGSRELWVVPQTSTIASHLPKAVGLAVAIGRRRTLGVRTARAADLRDDAIVLTSLGDASLNHASALTALNAARWARRVGLPVPLLVVCEDNGIGISVETPRGWVETTASSLPGIAYIRASGELHERWAAVEAAVDRARRGRTPVFLHLDTTRLWGHAGSDVEVAYRLPGAIEVAEARDPLVRTARQLLGCGAIGRNALATLVADVRAQVRERAEQVVPGTGHLRTAAEVMAPLAPHRPLEVRAEVAGRPLDPEVRARVHGRQLPEVADVASRRTLAAVLNATLRDELARREEVVAFGEDVGRKGGVYGVTLGLQATFGHRRVFDTLLDETSILGLAQGFALAGMLPVPEIQYLAYLHNALDQLRGEACSTSFFSSGAFTTPLVVRIAGLAYQKGFGGHFHNDNSLGALRDIPGLVVAVPSRPDDGARMLRGALAMAAVDGRVVAFVEPIALYHERDLHEPGDGGWLATYPGPDALLLPGEIGVHHPEADDVALVTYGNGVRMALRAARRLAEEGVRARVLDLRWLSPLPRHALLEHTSDVASVLVVDEARATGGGIADEVVALLAMRGHQGRLATVRSADSYVPLGPATQAVLLGEDDVVTAARELVGPAVAPSRRRRRTSRR